MEFDEELGGGRLNPADCIDHTCPSMGMQQCTCLGHLLLVWAVGYIDHSPTKFSQPGKKSDVVVVDVVDLDQADQDGYAGLLVRGAWWRNARLIGLLKSRIGRPKPILAWMGLGMATQGKPPYELHFASGDESAVARATAWMAGHPDFKPTAPQGRNPELEAVTPEVPVVRQVSQLEAFAARSVGRDPHQAQLREATAPKLPPPPPPARPIQDIDIPF